MKRDIYDAFGSRDFKGPPHLLHLIKEPVPFPEPPPPAPPRRSLEPIL
ncbi:unnamed protein product [Schistosoma margrebowiei]|uniref:Uncharacterized protein n=1 Tax=Schistosoma margrebowiei TaxID=48269 RepID=A0A183N450_9TREM|nr:unnamed protein product [Schistosoma margrebowiei]